MAPIIFRINPFLAICITVIRFDPKIIALGGVATGSIKAMEALIVAGIIKSKGFTSTLTESPASTGKSISVVAVLDVNSVKNVIPKAIIKIMIIG